MPICRTNKIIFVHIPRTAGTSIEKALGICGIDNKGSNASAPELLFGNDGNHFLQHLTALEIRESVGEPVFDSCFKFAIVRNPFARVVSGYHASVEARGRTFKWFITRFVPAELKKSLQDDHHRHFKPQKTFLVDQTSKTIVDYVGRQESLGNAIREVENHLGREIDVPMRDQARGEKYQEYFNDRLRRLVELYYADDLESFDYSFDPPVSCRNVNDPVVA